MTTPAMRQVTHHVTGNEADVIRVLDNAHAHGRLVSYRLPQRHPDGRVSIVITLLEPRPAARFRRWRLSRGTRRRLLLAAKVLAWAVGVAAVGLVGWGLWLLVHWIATHLAVVIGITVAGFLLAGLVAAATESPSSTSTGSRGPTHGVGGGGCVGVHCRGCGHQ